MYQPTIVPVIWTLCTLLGSDGEDIGGRIGDLFDRFRTPQAARQRHMNPEEARLDQFWREYYQTLGNFNHELSKLDWVAYYKNHGVQMQCGGDYGNRVQFRGVVVVPRMEFVDDGGSANGGTATGTSNAPKAMARGPAGFESSPSLPRRTNGYDPVTIKDAFTPLSAYPDAKSFPCSDLQAPPPTSMPVRRSDGGPMSMPSQLPSRVYIQPTPPTSPPVTFERAPMTPSAYPSKPVSIQPTLLPVVAETVNSSSEKQAIHREAVSKSVRRTYDISSLLKPGAFDGPRFSSLSRRGEVPRESVRKAPPQENAAAVAQQLVDTITASVEPHSWSSVGGEGTITFFAPARVIVVNQTSKIHHQIEDLLRQLRQFTDADETDAGDANRLTTVHDLEKIQFDCWRQRSISVQLEAIDVHKVDPAQAITLLEEFLNQLKGANFDGSLALMRPIEVRINQYRMQLDQGDWKKNASSDMAPPSTRSGLPERPCFGTGNTVIAVESRANTTDQPQLKQRIYSVADLTTDNRSAERLMDLITEKIAQESWFDAGGSGAIRYYPLGSALIVNQTEQVHEQVANFLEKLRLKVDTRD